jgi:hypothetical protein
VAHPLATAASVFEGTLKELGFSGTEPELGDLAQLARRAALLAVAGALWRRHLGPLLDSRQVRELLGVGTRQAVHDLVKRHRLLGLPATDGQLRFPVFQFSESGRPFEALPAILEVFSSVPVSPWTVASWFVTPQPELADSTPVERLRVNERDEQVIDVARHSAEPLSW